MDRKDVIKIIIFDTLILGAIAGVPYEVERATQRGRSHRRTSVPRRDFDASVRLR
jgi:hypothetical protein